MSAGRLAGGDISAGGGVHMNGCEPVSSGSLASGDISANSRVPASRFGPAACRRPVRGAISASMMCADILKLDGQLRTFGASGVEYLHIDVMDGSFVPNYALGTDYVKYLKKATSIPLDIHLMVDRPEDKLEWFDFGENDYVSFHVEATNHAQRAIRSIKDRGGKAAAAINPATPLYVLEEMIGELDAVLIMSVNPGYAGQRLVGHTVGKAGRLRDAYPEIIIEVDGNISFENAARMRAAGADIFVAGTSSIFMKSAGLEANIAMLRESIR